MIAPVRSKPRPFHIQGRCKSICICICIQTYIYIYIYICVYIYACVCAKFVVHWWCIGALRPCPQCIPCHDQSHGCIEQAGRGPTTIIVVISVAAWPPPSWPSMHYGTTYLYIPIVVGHPTTSPVVVSHPTNKNNPSVSALRLQPSLPVIRQASILLSLSSLCQSAGACAPCKPEHDA